MPSSSVGRGMPSSSVGRVFGHQWLSRWLKFRRSRFKSRWKREFLENSKNYPRCDNSSIKGTLCSAKPGCRVAQLVECLVTSGYPDGSSSGGPGKWKDSHPAVVEHDCPEINSSQRWCVCKKTPMWFRATETWAAAGLLSLARRKTTSCGNGWLETMRRHV